MNLTASQKAWVAHIEQLDEDKVKLLMAFLCGYEIGKRDIQIEDRPWQVAKLLQDIFDELK